MSDEKPLWRTLHRAIVLDLRVPRRPRVLAVHHPDGGWSLPEWVVEEHRAHDHDIGNVAAQARERLGLDVVILHYVDPVEDEAARERSGTWVMEPRVPEGVETLSPRGARWVTRTEQAGLNGAEGEAWVRVGRVLSELERGISPPGRCAWSEPGWFAGAEAWMVSQLETLGRPAHEPIRQFKNNSISTVLRAHTEAGDVYLKAASRHFGTEARITRALTQRYPEQLPVVLAADVERSWLLMEDFGPSLRTAGIDVWERALCGMGEMQRRCIGETEWLFSIGAADRRLGWLRERIPGLLDAPETRRELDETARVRLIARRPEFQDACDALAACGVPETLIHGDLHGGNVAHRDGHVTLFDWTDAAVAHPFLDLVTFLPTDHRPPSNITDPAAAAQRLLDAYLEGWTGYAPTSQLRRAVELLKTVQQLHHAQSYLQILRSIEVDDYWQWEGDLGEWLTPLVEAAPT